MKKFVAVLLVVCMLASFGIAPVWAEDASNIIATIDFETAGSYVLDTAGFPSGTPSLITYDGSDPSLPAPHSEDRYVAFIKEDDPNFVDEDGDGIHDNNGEKNVFSADQKAKGGLKVKDTIPAFTEQDIGKNVNVSFWVYVDELAGSNPGTTTKVRASVIGKNEVPIPGREPSSTENATMDTYTYTKSINVAPGSWQKIEIPLQVSADTLNGDYRDLRIDGGSSTSYAARMYVDDIVWKFVDKLAYTEDFEGYNTGSYSATGADPFIGSGGQNAKGPDVVAGEQANSGTKSVKKYDRNTNNSAVKFNNLFKRDLTEQDVGRAFHFSVDIYLDKTAGAYAGNPTDLEHGTAIPLPDDELAISDGQYVNIGVYGPSGSDAEQHAYKYATTAYAVEKKYVKWDEWTTLDFYYIIEAGTLGTVGSDNKNDLVNALRICQLGITPFADTFYLDNVCVTEIDPSEIPDPGTPEIPDVPADGMSFGSINSFNDLPTGNYTDFTAGGGYSGMPSVDETMFNAAVTGAESGKSIRIGSRARAYDRIKLPGFFGHDALTLNDIGKTYKISAYVYADDLYHIDEAQLLTDDSFDDAEEVWVSIAMYAYANSDDPASTGDDGVNYATAPAGRKDFCIAPRTWKKIETYYTITPTLAKANVSRIAVDQVCAGEMITEGGADIINTFAGARTLYVDDITVELVQPYTIVEITGENGTYQAGGSVQETVGTGAKTAKIILAEYDADDALVQVASSAPVPFDENTAFPIALSEAALTGVKPGNTLKAFVWNGAGLIPYHSFVQSTAE